MEKLQVNVRITLKLPSGQRRFIKVCEFAAAPVEGDGFSFVIGQSDLMAIVDSRHFDRGGDLWIDTFPISVDAPLAEALLASSGWTRVDDGPTTRKRRSKATTKSSAATTRRKR